MTKRVPWTDEEIRSVTSPDPINYQFIVRFVRDEDRRQYTVGVPSLGRAGDTGKLVEIDRDQAVQWAWERILEMGGFDAVAVVA